MPSSTQQVVIVGRPNVGKSSIFNWLSQRRIAIEDSTAGVTRDRLTQRIECGGKIIDLIDTGGMGFDDPDGLTEQIDMQIEAGLATAGVVVLGDIINSVTGSLENYADRALFSKLGITDYHWQITPTGLPMTGGGLGLKSRDLLKIGQLYLNGGKWNDNQIISEEFVQKSTEPHAEVGMFDYEYGYLWWLSKFGQEQKEKAYFMSGTGGNKIVVIPELELVVVLTSTYYNGGMESHNQTTKLMNEYIVPEIQKMEK